MALRTWGRMLLVAAGAAALVATSQLGLAYGLGIVRLTRVFGDEMRDHWPAQLAWVTWFAMVAATAGAWLAGWSARRRGEPPRPGLHAALAAAAGLGALTVVPLVMQPARTAQVLGVDPVIVIGISAGLGAVAGAFAGYAALAGWTARVSLLAVGGAVWLVALVSVVPSLGVTDPLPAARLGVLDAAFLSTATTQRFALFTMPAIALVAGAALGWTARRRDMPTLTIATAGLAGPALLTVSYLIAGPGSGGEHYQSVPYWAAVVATATGVLGSVLAAVIRRTEDDDAVTEGDRPGVDEPTAAFPAPGGGSGPDATPAFGIPGAPPATGPRQDPRHDPRPGPGRPGGETQGDPDLSELYTRHRATPPPAAPAPAGPPPAGPVVPQSGNPPHPPAAEPPPEPRGLSKLRRRRATGTELGQDRPEQGHERPGPAPDHTPGFLAPPGGPGGPPRVPDDPFHPGQPVGGGVGRRLPQPRQATGPRTPQPMQAPPAAPAPAAPPPAVPPGPAGPAGPAFSDARPPLDQRPPAQRPPAPRESLPPRGNQPPPFAARPIGEQPYGTPPFAAFGPPPEDDEPRDRRPGPDAARPAVPKKDADYVDWVSGLGDR
ncbi:hypothetical protein [Spirilliplanes yamanashiensis]|nr:hypothetical protein [Spirilliplanes yamanashiensis]MDP9815901.1 hypothetical protein [Spirilliplanes yamanashiensis]